MESLFLLIPLSVLAVGVAVGVFFWMNHDGQFDDDQGPAWSILLDNDRPTVETGDDDASADVTVAESGVVEQDRVGVVGSAESGVVEQGKVGVVGSAESKGAKGSSTE